MGAAAPARPAPAPPPTGRAWAEHGLYVSYVLGSRQHQIDMVRAIDVTGLKPVIDQTFALEEIADAFRHEEAAHISARSVFRSATRR